MKKVKNISSQELSIPEIGIVKAGETITVPEDFNNANFEVVEEKITTPEKAKEPKKENINNSK